MKKQTEIKGVQIFLLLSLISVFIISAPHIIRASGNMPAIMGDEPYYHARIASQIISEGIPSQDDFVYGSRPYLLNPYHLILAVFSLALGVKAASLAIPIICGLLSALLFYFILKELGFDSLNRIAISCVFILSPIFISIFSLSTPVCASTMLMLLGFFLFLKKDGKLFALSIIVFVAASLFSILSLAMIFLTASAYALANKKMVRRFYLLFFALAVTFLVYYVQIYFRFGTAFIIYSGRGSTNFVQMFITDLGGNFGFSIFALLLAGLGVVVVWNKKEKLIYSYLIMLAVVIFSFFFNKAAAYANFIIAVLAGVTLAELIKRKWELKTIRNLSITLLFCGLLFSAVSYTVRFSSQQPDTGIIEALDWIGQNSGQGDVIFSHYSKGFFAEFESSRPSVLDSRGYLMADFAERTEECSTAFASWDIKETQRILSKYNVTWVIVTKDMQEGLVWSEPEQGMAYLLTNSETFKKEYTSNSTGVWRYIYRENG